MKVTILGCSGSGGVPLIGCVCDVCNSSNPKNLRTRTSAYVEVNNARLLIDTSPDLRFQAIRENITRVDAVLYTHTHADHTHGIDEMRAFNWHAKSAIPIYGNAETISDLESRYSYALQPPPSEPKWNRPSLTPHVIADDGFFTVGNTTIQSFLQYHGKGKTLGYRIGNFAYSTDVNNLPNNSFQALESLDLWVVDCLRYDPAPTHAHLAMTLEWIERVKPKRAVLIHMAHDLEYESLKKQLPAHVEPGFDGLSITL